MAELHVERKPKSNTLWIVLAVLLLALIAWMSMRDGDDVNDTPTTQGTTTGALPVTMVPIGTHILLHT